MKRKWILPLVLIVLALGIGFRLAANKKKIDAAKQPVDRSAFAIPVNTITAEMGAVDGAFSVPGTLEPFDHAKVMVQAQGKLASLHVDLGSRVTKGQTLGSLDVAQRQLELSAAELQLEKLRKDDQRYRELVAGKAATEASYDDVHFNFETQKVKVDQIRQQIRDAQVISPVTGTVVAKNLEVGEYVGVGTAVVEVVDVTRLKAKVYVSERDAYRLQDGLPVTITTEVFPGETFQGKITFVSPRGDASHNYEVEVTVQNEKAHALKSGTFVSVRFGGSDQVAMLTIPKNALGDGMKDAYVYVVVGDTVGARVQRRDLVLGREVGERVEVTKGLQAGDVVVVSGQLNLVDGSLVKVTENGKLSAKQ
ncbi:MAG: efflux RND transporter periplasmic adaptor subunit [Flavobacteriales bacterium]|nr:efflux RND transporter periplasmic adaptor subunit [Flavobacteriales bacterium]